MADPAKPRKKVVAATPKKKTVVNKGDDAETSPQKKRPATWQASPQAKAKAGKFRIFAGIMWFVAIAAEALAIFWVLKQDEINMVLLIGLIVVIGLLAIGGSLLWKNANKLDPASEQDKIRFFVQNQLGLIITIIAFLPLIILIFTNKNMDGKQKAIAGSVGVIVALIAGYFGMTFDPPSTEQYSQEREIVKLLTGEDKVYWTKHGSVYHVCDSVPDVNKESQDNQIYHGSVSQAHDEGKNRIVSYWDRQAVSYCGYTQEDVDRVKAEVDGQSVPEETPDAED